MITWNEFKDAEPQLAQEGRDLLYDVGVGLGYLATVRADGGPRVHPICPIICTAGLFAFIVASPKQRDLHRDGRYALHTFPMADNEDAFYLAGQVRAVSDDALRATLAQQFVDERAAIGVPAPGPDEHLFEFAFDTAVLTRTTGHGDPAPKHTVWHG